MKRKIYDVLLLEKAILLRNLPRLNIKPTL